MIVPLSLSFTKDRQLAVFAILQANEIGSLPSPPTVDFYSNKNNQLNSSFFCWVHVISLLMSMQVVICMKKKMSLAGGVKFQATEMSSFYRIVLLQGYTAWTARIDLRSGALFACHRMTYILSPKCVFCVSPFVPLLFSSCGGRGAQSGSKGQR